MSGVAMCCFFAAMVLIGPRFAILLWWIIDSTRWELAWSNFFWPFAGFIIAPWTTLMWTAVAPGGVTWFDYILLFGAVLADIGSLTSGWRSRNYRTA